MTSIHRSIWSVAEFVSKNFLLTSEKALHSKMKCISSAHCLELQKVQHKIVNMNPSDIIACDLSVLNLNRNTIAIYLFFTHGNRRNDCNFRHVVCYRRDLITKCKLTYWDIVANHGEPTHAQRESPVGNRR